jgi:hypothetical protein
VNHSISWRDTRSVPFHGYATAFPLQTPTSLSGDVMLATLALGNSSNTALPRLTPPAGWSLVREIDLGTVSTLAVYVHIASSSEPTVYTWQSDLGIEGEAWISSYGGVDATKAIEAENGETAPQHLTSYSTPSLATVTPGAMIVASFAGHGTFTAWAPPANTNVRTSVTDGTSGDVRVGLAVDVAQGASGQITPLTATAPTNLDYALTHVLALRPAP